MNLLTGTLNNWSNSAKAKTALLRGDMKDVRFRGSLAGNKKALDTVERVEAVTSLMKSADGVDGVDFNKADGAVKVEGRAEKVGIKATLQGEDKTLQRIASQAPTKGEGVPTVIGSFDENMTTASVTFEDGNATNFSQTNNPDGSIVYQAGDSVVTRGPNGSLLMGV